jgi:hypothetical protein
MSLHRVMFKMPGLLRPKTRVHLVTCRLRNGEARCICPWCDDGRTLEFWTDAESVNEALANAVERYPGLNIRKQVDGVAKGLPPETEDFMLRHRIF